MKFKNNIIILIITTVFVAFDFGYISASSINSASSQTSTNNDIVPAQFPGGQKGFDKWLKKYVHYPEEVEALGIEETITVRFTVTKEGDIKYPYIEEGENDQLMDAALDAMRHMPKWIPATSYGQPIESQVKLELEFYIQQRIKRGRNYNKHGY